MILVGAERNEFREEYPERNKRNHLLYGKHSRKRLIYNTFFLSLHIPNSFSKQI